MSDGSTFASATARQVRLDSGPGDGAANDGYRVGFGEAIKAQD
jgi:hypothetical protein